ncbi:MAG: SDR family NAD(P)-dependent oxidoreductase [Legionella sp.]|uniref:SDR family NAD(P)-dependent oxidoreductase n=1 Tax=Legionella sp. TaxID=459 RepID=UPI0039E46E04
MTQRTWVILGATSIIAEKFAHLAAEKGHYLCLVGRHQEQLDLLAHDIPLRYPISCDVLCADLSSEPQKIYEFLTQSTLELDLFIAHSDFTDNSHLNTETIIHLIKTNIQATILLIDVYLKRQQTQHHLIYLSSVAACRGRASNSLYGASKACIEVYLQGLQQAATTKQHIIIGRLGFVDTKQTYGLAGIFYAGSPKSCAKACWHALKKKKRLFYFPFFWRAIIALIICLPFALYKKIDGAANLLSRNFH